MLARICSHSDADNSGASIQIAISLSRNDFCSQSLMLWIRSRSSSLVSCWLSRLRLIFTSFLLIGQGADPDYSQGTSRDGKGN